MQAVIATGGKQYLVRDGEFLNVELVGEEIKLIFDPLLVIDGKDITVGTPLVDKIKVHAEVLETVKGEKIKILKFKAKKRVKRLTGHRQKYSQIKITKIG